MLHVKLIKSAGLAVLEPEGKLTQKDFESAAASINPLIDQLGKLNGLIVHVKSFPHWDSFSSLISHFKFIKEHHRHVAKIAFVTDSTIGTFAEKIASHFVKAEIRHFALNEVNDAQNWITH